MPIMKSLPLILQSHYPNWPSAVGEQKFGKIGLRRHRFGRLFCWSTEVKSFVDRSADFQGFCHWWSVGWWSPDDRPTYWRNLHHYIDRRSPDYRASISRRSPGGQSMTFYQITVGWQSSDHRPIINFKVYDRPNGMCYYLHPYNLWKILHLFYFVFISLDLVYKYYQVCVLDFLLNYLYDVLKLT